MQALPLPSSLERKSLLALDYGTKFCGLATYKVGIDPFPLMHGRVSYQDDETLVNYLQSIIEEDFIDIMVVGIPFFTDGSSSKLTQRITNFYNRLARSLKIPCFSVDETLTTFEAEQRMLQDPKFNFKVDPKQIDALSATIILEEFIKTVENKNHEKNL